MNIKDRVNYLRDKAKAHARYHEVANLSGVSVHWLHKFAMGVIQNPTVENVAKLEAFFADELGENQTQSQQ